MSSTVSATTISIIDAIAAHAERIPATFWGVVVGSFFTLLGIYFTNRSQAGRQKVDLEHDRTERKNDREFAARKEIFLEAAGGLYGLTQCLAKISNAEIPFAQTMAENNTQSGPIARAYIIASDETIQAIAKLTSGIQANILKLSTLRHQVDARRRQAADLVGKEQRHQEAAGRVIESVRRVNLEEGLEGGRASAARIMLEYEQKQEEEARQARDRILLETHPLEIELAEAAVAAGRELWPDIVAALAAVRAELGLPTDQAKLRAIMEDSAWRPLEEFDRIVRDLKADIERRKGGKGPATK